MWLVLHVALLPAVALISFDFSLNSPSLNLFTDRVDRLRAAEKDCRPFGCLFPLASALSSSSHAIAELQPPADPHFPSQQLRRSLPCLCLTISRPSAAPLALLCRQTKTSSDQLRPAQTCFLHTYDQPT
ncbi:hypothetical protein GGI42DRAFT_257318 [Trichoderma sp. SZMC 28013]